MNDIVSLIGIPDDNQATVMVNKGTPSSFQINIEGTNDLNNIVDRKKFPFHQVILGGDQPKLPNIDQSKFIINTICDPDTCKKALHLASELIKKLDVPVINHPDNILKTTRDNIYELFKNTAGIRAPKTIRIAPRSLNDIRNLMQNGSLAFPSIVREAGKHSGLKTFLLEKPDQIHELEQFAFDGRDYYITVFVDFRSRDGLYRKARFFIINGTFYPRHVILSTNWNIHAGSRKELMANSTDYQLEEEKFLNYMDCQILHRCRILYETLKLEFFGIDCNISDENELLIFEINASMKPFGTTTPFPYLKRSSDSIRGAINDLFVRRLNSV